MNMMRRYGKGSAFTLIELLVVVAIIGLLMALVLPALGTAQLRARLATKSADGRSVVQMIAAQEATSGIYGASASAWPIYGATDIPSNNTFKTSTEFFRYAITNGSFEVSASFFSAPGLPQARDSLSFSATNNAWSVVGTVTESYPSTGPVIMSRNLGGGADAFTAMDGTLTGNAAKKQIVQQLGGQPFEDKGFVFATKGCSGFALMKETLRINDFTNLFQRLDQNGVILTNSLLRP